LRDYGIYFFDHLYLPVEIPIFSSHIGFFEMKIEKVVYELVGFIHPKKIARLEYVLKKGWKFKRYDNDLPNHKILAFLKENDRVTVARLALFLNRHRSTVREHLEELERDGLIFATKTKRKINNVTHHYYLWSVRNELQS